MAKGESSQEGTPARDQVSAVAALVGKDSPDAVGKDSPGAVAKEEGAESGPELQEEGEGDDSGQADEEEGDKSEQEEEADGVVRKRPELEEEISKISKDADDLEGDSQIKHALPRVSSSSWSKEKMKDPEYVRRNYLWGIRKGTLLWMFTKIVLLNLLMSVLPIPAVRINDPDCKVWRFSLLICRQLFFLITPLRTTASFLSILTNISYGPLLALAASDLIGPHAGLTVIHLSTAWAAGMSGYTLAKYRLHVGTENAASVAVAQTPSGWNKKGRRYTRIHCIVFASMVTLSLAVRLLWLLFIPTYKDICMAVLEVSLLIWNILYFWLIVLSPLMLHGTVISMDSMIRIYVYFIVSCPFGVAFARVSRVRWAAYFLGLLEMMIMAGVCGYARAVLECYQEMMQHKKTVPGRRRRKIKIRRLLLGSIPPGDLDMAPTNEEEANTKVKVADENDVDNVSAREAEATSAVAARERGMSVTHTDSIKNAGTSAVAGPTGHKDSTALTVKKEA